MRYLLELQICVFLENVQIFKYLTYTQCRNFRIFQSFRFNVKPILEKCRLQNCQNCRFAISVALDFVHLTIFRLQKRLKFMKNIFSEPLNVLEQQILHFQNPNVPPKYQCPKWVSPKIFLFSTLCIWDNYALIFDARWRHRGNSKPVKCSGRIASMALYY